MELARFLASSLPQQKNGFALQVVVDNARSHSTPKPIITSQTNRRTTTTRKVCRWDSSLSKREATVPSLGSPKRSTDALNNESNSLQLLRVNDDLYHGESEDIMVLRREVVRPAGVASSFQHRFDSCRIDDIWEEGALSKESSRDHKDPPRMPLRNADHFPEVDERRAVICLS